MVALWAWAQGQRGRPRLVRAAAEFRAPVETKDHTLFIEATIRRKRHLNFGEVAVRTPAGAVASVSLVLAVIAAA